MSTATFLRSPHRQATPVSTTCMTRPAAEPLSAALFEPGANRLEGAEIRVELPNRRAPCADLWHGGRWGSETIFTCEIPLQTTQESTYVVVAPPPENSLVQ